MSIRRRHLHTRAAVAVEDPQLDRRDPGARAILLPGNQKVAIVGPHRRTDVRRLVLGEHVPMRAVDIDQPQILHAVLIAGERDRLPVRRELRVIVVGRPVRERRRCAALNRQRVQVPEESKTIVLPSGETSSDIHVPSVVSNRTVRPSARGVLIAAATSFGLAGRGGRLRPAALRLLRRAAQDTPTARQSTNGHSATLEPLSA